MTTPSPLTLTDAERQRIDAIDGLVAREGAGAVADLLGMLGEPSWAVRRAVVAALAALGDAAVEPLCALLRARRDDEARIAAAVDALVASAGAAERGVVALADDPNPAVVADAAQILGRRRSAAQVHVLVRLMQHTDDNVAVAAIEALGRIGGRAAVDALVAAVQSGSFFRTFPAIDVLGRSGDPRAVAPLARLLEQPTYATEACRALGRTGERSAVAPLVQFLMAHTADAGARLAASALAELHGSYAARFGTVQPIEDALRRAADPAVVVRRLTQALTGADAAEQTSICLLLGVIGNEAAITALTALLDSPATLDCAAKALESVGRRASELELLKALREGDSARRRGLLPRVVTPAGVDEVMLCLGDPAPAVRAMACDALARIGGTRAVPALFRLLGETDPRVVQAATAAIQSLGSRDTERLALEAAAAPQAGVRRAAIRILSYFGYASALPRLVDALSDPDPRVRDTAIQGLPFIEDPRALERLLELARDEDDPGRATAMRALGQCPEDPRVTAFLLRGLGDPAPWVRYYACQSLGKLGLEEAAQVIAPLVRDPAGQVRVAAVEALSHLKGPVATDALQEAAGSSEPDLQRAALIGLGLQRRPESLPLLLTAASSSEAATRLVALSALAGFESPQVLAALGRALSDADEGVRTAAIGFLAAAPGAEATRMLVDFLHDEGLRPQLLAALGTPHEDRVAGVLAMIDQASEEQAPWLVSVLSRLRDEGGQAGLHRALRSSNPAARKAAAAALAELGTDDAMGALQDVAARDADPEVRRVCELLLAR